MMDRKHPSPARRVTYAVVALAASLLAFAETASADFLDIMLRGTMQVTSYTCDPNGVSTIHFTASGNSILSHPGSFVASGAFTIGAQTQPGYHNTNFRPVGQLLTWSENVVIDSPSGPVAMLSTGIVEPPAGFAITGARINTGTCAFVENVTLSSVQNATGRVIEAYGTAGMRAASGASLPGDAFASSIAVEMLIQSSSIGGFTASSFDQSFWTGAIVPLDTTPPTLTVPTDLLVDATSAGGAVVTFDVSATDNADPFAVVTCAPASGTLFAVGDTTVSCHAADASGNTASASFSVHVKGAAEQLDELRHAVEGVGPGVSLADKGRSAQAALSRNDLAATCSILRAFANQVTAQSGKSIPAGTAAALAGAANRISAVLAC